MKLNFIDGIIVRNRDGLMSAKKETMTVENGMIISFGKEEKDGKVISLKGKWVFPGLINTHGHAGMTLLRGLSDDVPLEVWLSRDIWPAEAKLTKTSIITATQLAMVEMIKSGTTTFLDMYHPFYTNEIAEEVTKSGMRAVIMGGMLGFGDEKEQEKKLQFSKSFIENWHKKDEGRITSMIAPHSTYTCKPDFLEKSLILAKELGVGIHLHAHETEEEIKKVKEMTGFTPIQLLKKLGCFNVPTLLAHVVHVTEEDLNTLIEHQVSISHNPHSNLKLGSGIAPITKMIDKGLNVSLGTDSVASNNNLDLIQEMRTALLLQKGVMKKADALSLHDAFYMVTKNGAKALNLPNLGELKIGQKADFLTIDPRNKAHLQPEKEMLSHFVYSASGQDVSDVYVNGKCLMNNRNLVTMDEEKIIHKVKNMLQ